MVEFFTFTEASRGPPEASWRSGLWTAVRRLSTPDLGSLSNGDIINALHGHLTRFSRSRHFWSRLSQIIYLLRTKLL